jgi:hypothetical protein
MLFYSFLLSILDVSISVVFMILISRLRIRLFREPTSNIQFFTTSHKPFWIIPFNFLILIATYQIWSGGINDFAFFSMMILIMLVNIDMLTYFLPFELLFALIITILLQIHTAQQWSEKGIGFLSTAAILYMVYIISNRSEQKKEIGFGFGDVIYGSCLGMNLGWYGGLYSISFGLIISGLYAAILMLLGKEKESRIPLSPFFLVGLAIYERIIK